MRKQFYQNTCRLTGFPEERCRQLLIEQFGQTFDPTRVEEYLKYLKELADDEKTRARFAEWKEVQRCRLQAEAPAPGPCMIPDCKGIMQMKGSMWECTIGGLHHYMIAKAAAWSGCSIEKMVGIMAKIVDAKMQQARDLRQQYREGLNNAQAQEALAPNNQA